MATYSVNIIILVLIRMEHCAVLFSKQIIPLKQYALQNKVYNKTTKELGSAETKVTHKRLILEYTSPSLLHNSTVSYCPLVAYIDRTASIINKPES